jgi:hypothetical protein
VYDGDRDDLVTLDLKGPDARMFRITPKGKGFPSKICFVWTFQIQNNYSCSYTFLYNILSNRNIGAADREKSEDGKF